MRKIIKLPVLYKESYTFSDKVVLLSGHFKNDFLKYARLKEDSKIRIIHNALSFQSFYDMANYGYKKKCSSYPGWRKNPKGYPSL